MATNLTAQSPSTAEAASAPSAAALRKMIDNGRAAEALAQIDALRADGKPHDGLALLAGLADFAKADLPSADKEFATALKEQPGNQEATEMRGLVLVKLGRPADAIPLLEAAAKNNQGGNLRKADPNYALALCYVDTRRYDDARHAFATQFGFAPDGPQAYLLAARMLLRREFVPVALEFAQKAVSLDAALPGAHGLIGEIALAQGRIDDAIREFELERQRSPLEGSTYDRLGDAYNRAGRYDEAQRSLQEAVLLEPNATGPFILLGKTMLKKNDAASAASYLQHAAQMDPANYMTHNLLGQAYRALGRTEQARSETALGEKLQRATEPQLQTAH
ncbi:tetratricopeptide repeat protein [Bryocella elongata]|uniref:tetratricopeptide repeat protein n=1 Tax=Bryocella elongata TaxID=863522 RepID=UPI001F40EC6A|nr:tetratricopeptide repeat protein [Bryocella elongata]